MISKYYVKYENGEKVVYLCLNNNFEFGSFNKFNNNLNNVFKQIYKFYNCNKFKIVTGGIVVATLFLNTNNIKNIESLDNKIIYLDKMVNTSKNPVLVENEIIEVLNEEDSIKENTKIIPELFEKHIVDDNKTYQNLITIYRKNGSIMAIELEDYIIGVVASEMPVSFNIEALKAQAIVSRTYALKRISENKILTDDSSTQNFKDPSQLKLLWGNNYDLYYNKVKSAVLETSGMFIAYNNNYIDSVYHSTSNGKTEDSYNVWGFEIPYLKSVDSSYDVFASSYKRTTEFNYDFINKKLGVLLHPNSDIIINKNSSNRINEIIIDGNLIKGVDFRNILGLRSNDFSLELNDSNVIITTYGYGHGVGMSQYGAQGMANNGYNYDNIIKHYYTNVEIKR